MFADRDLASMPRSGNVVTAADLATRSEQTDDACRSPASAARGGGKRVIVVGLLALLVVRRRGDERRGADIPPALRSRRAEADRDQQNMFAYAADGSLLGAIPAERNREVVPLRQIRRGSRPPRSRSRTAASTSTAASMPRASPAQL